MPAKGSEAIPKSKSVTMSVKLQQKFWKSKTMGLKRKKILLKARMRDPRTFFFPHCNYSGHGNWLSSKRSIPQTL